MIVEVACDSCHVMKTDILSHFSFASFIQLIMGENNVRTNNTSVMRLGSGVVKCMGCLGRKVILSYCAALSCKFWNNKSDNVVWKSVEY